METLWFIIITFMLAMYVILDGFDIGVGIIHRLIGRTENERKILIRTIGPVWDGNEVWLLAAGGTLYFAFPKLYASAFSGMYLPLIIVLWLLITRAIGLEFRHQLNNTLWISFWDSAFSLASILLAIFFGAALGNIIRGVNLNSEGYFSLPLWTTLTLNNELGVLDWFTILMGLVALVTLTLHGANYVAMKTIGDIQSRARHIAKISYWCVIIFSIVTLISVNSIRNDFWNNYVEYPWGIIFPLISIISILIMPYFFYKGRDTQAFISSSIFILGMLSTTAFSLFPYLIFSRLSPDSSITVYNAAANRYGLSVGLIWWILGIFLTIGYFVYLYRSFKGKITTTDEGNGY